MDKIINIELLSLILGYDVYEFYIQNGYITSARENGSKKTTISLDDFNILCTEWIINNDYSINLNTTNNRSKRVIDRGVFYEQIKITTNDGKNWEEFNNDTELESILEAVEWIAQKKEI